MSSQTLISTVVVNVLSCRQTVLIVANLLLQLLLAFPKL